MMKEDTGSARSSMDHEKFLQLWQLNFQKIPPPTLIWDPTAINFHEKFHPLCLLGTLRQLGTLE